MTPEEIVTKIFGCVSSDGSYLELRDAEATDIIRAAIREALEQAAKVAEAIAEEPQQDTCLEWRHGVRYGCDHSAAAIRALAEVGK